jgi:sialic acid synthase SpsE
MKNYMTKNFTGGGGPVVSEGKPTSNIYDYLCSLCFSEEQWTELFNFTKQQDLMICPQCGDIYSVNFVNTLDPDIHTIAAPCFVEGDFIVEIAKTDKPVLLRIGGASLREIQNTISILKNHGNDQIILLHGVQTYPTKIEDTNLKQIQSLKEEFNLLVGIADHVDADLSFANVVPNIAVSLGACVVEKHITFDRCEKGEDFESALNPDEFKQMVDNIRLTEKALGGNKLEFASESDLKYRSAVRKKTVARTEIKKGQTIDRDLIIFKRADEGISPDEIKNILGKKAKYDIKIDEGITFEKII